MVRIVFGLMLALVSLSPTFLLEIQAQTVAPVQEYVVLATSKTSTMQKELTEAGKEGFAFVGMTVAETLMGGPEVVTILRRVTAPAAPKSQGRGPK